METDLTQSGFSFRSASMDDVEEVTTLLNDHIEELTGMRVYTDNDTKNRFSAPGFDIESSTRIVESPDGQLVGFIMVSDLNSPPVHPSASGCVKKSHEGQGIGTALLQWAEQRARQAIVRVPDGVRVSMRIQTSIQHEPTIRLFEKSGLSLVRYYWFMEIDLDTEIPEPQWPAGITVRTFKEYPDLREIFSAIMDAFKDHWGYVDSSEEERYKRWHYFIENSDDFVPELWFIAMDGDQIAGVEICLPRMGENADMGVVETLGVRRPWRRRGLALALLQQAFIQLKQRGKKQAGLGVDADSLTGATRLYEKAGMRVAQEIATYEKELRLGEDISVQKFDS